MVSVENKKVLVIGLGASGRAACRLLLQRGAHVTAVDGADSPALRNEAEQLEALGVSVQLGVTAAPSAPFDLAILSPGVPVKSPLVREIAVRGIKLIGELELGYQNARCLSVAVTGTNGKTTTTELVERILTHCHRKTVSAGNIGLPLCEVAEQSKDLDFLSLEVSSYQLETTEFFRPAVAVLLNITPDHLDRYDSMADYAMAKARMFMNQQLFDWAIVQQEALAQLQALGTKIRSKVITFSAQDRNADLFLDRSLIISRIRDWAGPVLDMDECLLRGPHNAENLMAALAVGRVLRLPLEMVTDALKTYAPAPHRCEVVAEVDGVRFVNDSKATNLDALQKAVLSMPNGRGFGANVILIAGGKDKGLEYHDIGPILSQRVKRVILIGETREKIRAAWGLFTPCEFAGSLPEAVFNAAQKAEAGDIVLLSPACSSFDMFQNYQHRGEVFRQAVREWSGNRGGGSGAGTEAPSADEQAGNLNH